LFTENHKLDTMALVHNHIIIRGKVQGVFFRASARQAALRFGVTGTVRNDPQGHVVAEAEGEEDAVRQFVTWCHHGPGAACVTAVEVTQEPLRGYEDFKVLR
jgi:acylphosphatase